MINLLPPERAQALRYGRLNAVLARWFGGVCLAIAGLIVIIMGGGIYIGQQSNNLQASISDSQQQLKAQDLPQVQAQADEISGDVKVINQVLSREINYSGLLEAIGKIMPAGTVLNSLTLTNANGALDLSANAKNYAAAAQIAVNLGDPKNGLFSKVDIISINCTTGKSTYSCTTELKALFSTSAQKQFLIVAKAGQP